MPYYVKTPLGYYTGFNAGGPTFTPSKEVQPHPFPNVALASNVAALVGGQVVSEFEFDPMGPVPELKTQVVWVIEVDGSYANMIFYGTPFPVGKLVDGSKVSSLITYPSEAAAAVNALGLKIAASVRKMILKEGQPFLVEVSPGQTVKVDSQGYACRPNVVSTLKMDYVMTKPKDTVAEPAGWVVETENLLQAPIYFKGVEFGNNLWTHDFSAAMPFVFTSIEEAKAKASEVLDATKVVSFASAQLQQKLSKPISNTVTASSELPEGSAPVNPTEPKPEAPGVDVAVPPVPKEPQIYLVKTKPNSWPASGGKYVVYRDGLFLSDIVAGTAIWRSDPFVAKVFVYFKTAQKHAATYEAWVARRTDTNKGFYSSLLQTKSYQSYSWYALRDKKTNKFKGNGGYVVLLHDAIKFLSYAGAKKLADSLATVDIIEIAYTLNKDWAFKSNLTSTAAPPVVPAVVPETNSEPSGVLWGMVTDEDPPAYLKVTDGKYSLGVIPYGVLEAQTPFQAKVAIEAYPEKAKSLSPKPIEVCRAEYHARVKKGLSQYKLTTGAYHIVGLGKGPGGVATPIWSKEPHSVPLVFGSTVEANAFKDFIHSPAKPSIDITAIVEQPALSPITIQVLDEAVKVVKLHNQTYVHYVDSGLVMSSLSPYLAFRLSKDKPLSVGSSSALVGSTLMGEVEASAEYIEKAKKQAQYFVLKKDNWYASGVTKTNKVLAWTKSEDKAMIFHSGAAAKEVLAFCSASYAKGDFAVITEVFPPTFSSIAEKTLKEEIQPQKVLTILALLRKANKMLHGDSMLMDKAVLDKAIGGALDLLEEKV